VRLPRDVDPQRLVRALRALGYVPTRQAGSHIRITTQLNGQHHEVIPNHTPIKIGTLQSILSSIANHHQIPVEELVKRLSL
jgi:predicted RNA binding protein YcfA (HicA-like mRNA interferase family)